MNLVTKEMLSDLLNVAKTASEFVTEQAVDIVNQALNYALFEAVISLLATLSLYLGYYFIHKIIVGAENANKLENTEASNKTANALKTIRQLVLVLFTGIVLYRAQDAIRAIGKITISPKVYLIEEGAKILEKVKSHQAGK
jgi:hypothetical protein